MVTAFWSPNHGQTGTTTTALTLSVMTAITNNYKVLLGHSHLQRSTLERCLLQAKPSGDDGLISFSDNGLDALRRLAKNGRLMPEKVSDYTTPLLIGNRLDLLQGVESPMDRDSVEETDILRRIFNGARGAYDLVMIDVHSGNNLRLTQMLLDDADVVVICLNQNHWLLEDYFKDDRYQALFQGKKIIYHIGSYSKESKYTLKNIKNLYKLECVIGTPYSPALMDACNNGMALDFLMRHISAGKKDNFWPLMRQLKESTESFLGALGQIEEALA